MVSKARWYTLNTISVTLGLLTVWGAGWLAERAHLPHWAEQVLGWLVVGLTVTFFGWSSHSYREYAAAARGEPLPPRVPPRRVRLGFWPRVALATAGLAGFFCAAAASTIGTVGALGLASAIAFYLGTVGTIPLPALNRRRAAELGR